MIEIEQSLAQASFRLRAYFAVLTPNGQSVGWRHDPMLCPVAGWLRFEAMLADEFGLLAKVHADAEWIILGARQIATPVMLGRFVDLIDQAACTDSNQAVEAVSYAEALAALVQAETWEASHLLPERAENNRRCAYPSCKRPAVTPWVHGFLSHQQQGKPVREACREFAGSLCEEHWPLVVVPRTDWWEHPGHTARTQHQALSTEQEGQVVLVCS